MNGQEIDVEECTFEGGLDTENCPTVEEELENLKKGKEGGSK